MTESQANYLILLEDQANLKKWKRKYRMAIKNKDFSKMYFYRRASLIYASHVKADLQRVELYREGFIE